MRITKGEGHPEEWQQPDASADERCTYCGQPRNDHAMRHVFRSPTPERDADAAGEAFWLALGVQQEYYDAPTKVHDDPIYCIRTRPGFIFDDNFWLTFQQFPFQICHVAYYGLERKEDEERRPPKGVFELRWTSRAHERAGHDADEGLLRRCQDWILSHELNDPELIDDLEARLAENADG